MWQEMLTGSGAPDLICFPFGWQIHFAMSFLPLLAFRPLLAKCESSLLDYVGFGVTYLLVMHFFVFFTFLYFNVMCFYVCHCVGT